MPSHGIRFAVGRIDFENAVDPRRILLVVQIVEGEMNRHGIQRFGRNPERQVGLLGGRLLVVVFESQVGQLFVGLVKLWIEIGSLLRVLDGALAEAFRLYLRQAEISLRVLVVDLEGLFIQVVCFIGVEAFEKQVAPADAIIGVFGKLLDQIAKLVVRVVIAFDAPESLGAEIGIGAGGELGVTGLRFVELAMMTKAAAVVERLRPQRKNEQEQGSARTLAHLSSSACVLANWIKRS